MLVYRLEVFLLLGYSFRTHF